MDDAGCRRGVRVARLVVLQLKYPDGAVASVGGEVVAVWADADGAWETFDADEGLQLGGV